MSRSVVLKGTVRCERCRMAPRWCVCAGQRSLSLPVAVDIIQHSMEVHKPSSTGGLLQRVVEGARVHIHRDREPLEPTRIKRPGFDTWILHPLGEPMPLVADPSRIQLVLLDGSWTQAKMMVRSSEPLGRKVSLRMQGQSRYWLRTQNGEGKFSTAEALLFVLDALGLTAEAEKLRIQFELHVYAGLLARGKPLLAEDFLKTSPLGSAMPELVTALR